MVLRRNGQRGITHRTACFAHIVKGLCAGGFLQNMTIDKNQITPVIQMPDEMRIPDFIKQRQCALATRSVHFSSRLLPFHSQAESWNGRGITIMHFFSVI